MKNFDLKKYLAEGKLLKEDYKPSHRAYNVIDKSNNDKIVAKELSRDKALELAKTNKDYMIDATDRLAEGKLSEGVWKIGNPDDIRDFIKKLAELKRDYWDVVGSDTVIDGIDSAMDEAKILLDVKMGNVQPEEFDLEVNEDVSFGGAGTDKRSGQVIGDIIQLIRSTGIDPSDVMEEVGQEFGINFEFGRG